MKRPKIIIEEKIPYIRGVFENIATVKYLSAVDINRDSLNDADVLVTRTRPRLDKSLLESSSLKVIATATIGTDHIDLDFCKAQDIKVVNAPGCNAPAVAQWTMTAAMQLLGSKGLSNSDYKNITFGVVGVGHVGIIVANWARQLGFNMLLNDPPRAQVEKNIRFVELDEMARMADVISFHTPLVRDGAYPTFHLADTTFFQSLGKTPFILNASRGAVVDNVALIKAINSQLVAGAAIDTWEGEPFISLELLKRVPIATPHIAGYSKQGKLRATAAVVKEIARILSLPLTNVPNYPVLEPSPDITSDMLADSYNILEDTKALKENPQDFEILRDNYLLRNEPGFND